MQFNSDRKINATELFQNISGELSYLARLADQLDDLIGNLAIETSEITAPERLQDMDALRQSLHALVLITKTAADEISDEPAGSVSREILARGVTLERIRLTCLQLTAVDPEPSPSEEVILF